MCPAGQCELEASWDSVFVLFTSPSLSLCCVVTLHQDAGTVLCELVRLPFGTTSCLFGVILDCDAVEHSVTFRLLRCAPATLQFPLTICAVHVITVNSAGAFRNQKTAQLHLSSSSPCLDGAMSLRGILWSRGRFPFQLRDKFLGRLYRFTEVSVCGFLGLITKFGNRARSDANFNTYGTARLRMVTNLGVPDTIGNVEHTTTLFIEPDGSGRHYFGASLSFLLAAAMTSNLLLLRHRSDLSRRHQCLTALRQLLQLRAQLQHRHLALTSEILCPLQCMSSNMGKLMQLVAVCPLGALLYPDLHLVLHLVPLEHHPVQHHLSFTPNFSSTLRVCPLRPSHDLSLLLGLRSLLATFTAPRKFSARVGTSSATMVR